MKHAIELHLTRGEAVYVRQALKKFLGTQDLRLTKLTQAVGKAFDQIEQALKEAQDG